MSSYAAAGNLFTVLFVNTIHHRLFPHQWLRRTAVRCFSHNTDGSGLPVRYVSKRHREVDQKQHTTSVDISPKDGTLSISDSSVFTLKSSEGTKGLQVGNNEGKLSNAEGRLSNALLDSKYVLNHWDSRGKEVTNKEHMKVREQVVNCMKSAEVDAHESLTCKSDDLSEGFELIQEMSSDGLVDEEYVEAPEEVFEEAHLINGNVKDKPERTRQGAEKLAVTLLAKRAFTAIELRKKLVAKQFPLNIVEAVLRDFQDRGLINDGLYAETFSHSRWNSSTWGPRRIKQALAKKGVSELDVEKAAKLVFEDSEEGGQRSNITLSSSSLQQLFIQALKQWQRSQNVPHEKRKARVIRWLQYRGFDWGVVGTIMKKLESEYP